MADISTRQLVTGFTVGAAVVFAAALLIALGLGAGLLIAIVVGAFIGLVVGGSVGFLVAGRRAQDR